MERPQRIVFYNKYGEEISEGKYKELLAEGYKVYVKSIDITDEENAARPEKEEKPTPAPINYADFSPGMPIEVEKSAERTLKIIGAIVLVASIIPTIFVSIYVYEEELPVEVLAIAIYVLFSGMLFWSICKVLSNISISLKEINQKVK